MAYDTWDWSKATGAGRGMTFKPERYDPISAPETEAGYMQTSPQFTRGLWIFKLQYHLILPQGFVYLVDFHHSHRGGVPFYVPWPNALAGIPDVAELAVPGGIDPWDSEVTPGAGEGPTFLMFWTGDSFPLTRVGGYENYWRTDGTIELRQV